LVPLNGFGLRFGVRCWNLPLAILVEHKRASDNALQEAVGVSIRVSGESKGQSQ
jgi:hypothetical protein